MRQIPRKLQELDEDGNVLGFYPAAFAQRDSEEYLSVNWLEFFEGTHDHNVANCKDAIQAVRKATTARHGVAQVGRIKELAQHSAKPVRIYCYPTDGNPSHCAVKLDQPVPDAACEDLAREFFKQHY